MPWDMAAGSLLVEEAGGKVSGMQGEPYDVEGKYVLATNGTIQAETLALFGDIFAGRYPQEMPMLPAKDWE
jgi:myo-inositol-1(or 4)-monophosphatase